MQPEQFDDLLAQQPALAAHADFLRSLLKPCVRISISQQGPNGAQSQFEGKPMVPPGFAWPQHSVGVYRFLGQINFADIANRPADLPDISFTARQGRESQAHQPARRARHGARQLHARELAV